MGTAVGVDGDVVATAGSTLHAPATDGSWSAGAVTYTTYSKLTAGGVAVIYKAECTFTFSGEQKQGSSTTPVNETETVTLEASSTPLQGGLQSCLLDGDSETGEHGNELKVSASQTKLKTG